MPFAAIEPEVCRRSADDRTAERAFTTRSSPETRGYAAFSSSEQPSRTHSHADTGVEFHPGTSPQRKTPITLSGGSGLNGGYWPTGSDRAAGVNRATGANRSNRSAGRDRTAGSDGLTGSDRRTRTNGFAGSGWTTRSKRSNWTTRICGSSRTGGSTGTGDQQPNRAGDSVQWFERTSRVHVGWDNLLESEAWEKF